MTIRKALGRFQLKWIAAAAMLADHICLVLAPDNPAAELIRLSAGRIAMPVFAFLLCEGFYYTRSRKQYAFRLLFFALLSEPVYDAALYGAWFDLRGQNVFFTLAAGLFLLILLEYLMRKGMQIIGIPVIAAFAAAAWFARLDQDIAALAMILCFYYLRTRPLWIRVSAACTAAVICYGQPGYFLALPLLLLYNGEKGPDGAAAKYLFYFFYPAHLLVLALAAHSFF